MIYVITPSSFEIDQFLFFGDVCVRVYLHYLSDLLGFLFQIQIPFIPCYDTEFLMSFRFGSQARQLTAGFTSLLYGCLGCPSRLNVYLVCLTHRIRPSRHGRNLKEEKNYEINDTTK